MIARERETAFGDHIDAVAGIGASRPALAWPLTISMLGLAGLPGTAGFIGKFFLIEASVDGGFTWLGIVIVVGSMVSLVYYLRVIAAMWMEADPLSGRRVDGHARDGGRVARGGRGRGHAPPRRPETIAVGLLAAAATVVFGIVPSPLLDIAADAGRLLAGTAVAQEEHEREGPLPPDLPALRRPPPEGLALLQVSAGGAGLVAVCGDDGGLGVG